MNDSGQPVLRYFGDYELLEELARGGMGVVYRARQVSLDRVVALKILVGGALALPSLVERFRQEARAAATLDHPNIVPVYDVGEVAGEHFFTMKLVEGGSLARALSRDGARYSPNDSVRLVARLARAVHYAHQRGILHRDLKPGNVLLERQGEPQLTDFGLAKLLEQDSTLTHTHAMLGTPAYMSPEQALGRGGLTTAVDVYGLGAVLFELLTGAPPFAGGTTMETVHQVIHREPRAPSSVRPDIDRDLDVICLKCLEKSPERRYSSADALAVDLDHWLKSEPILARRIGPGTRITKWVRRRPRVAALAALALAAIIGLIVVPAWMSIRIAAANRRAEWQAKESRERLVQLQVTTGLAAMKEGDLFGALPWLVEALKFEEGDAARSLMHRTRIATALNYSPRLVQVLFHETNMTRAVYGPEGQRLLLFSESAGFAQVVDAQSGQPITPRLQHSGPLVSAQFSRRGDRILTASVDGTARLWNAFNGVLEKTFPHEDRVESAWLSPNDQSVLTVSVDSVVRVWDVPGGRLRLELRHGERPYDAVFSPDGRWIAVGLRGKVRLWDARTGKESLTLTMDGREAARRLSFSSDGQRIQASGGGGLQVWDVTSGKAITPLFTHPNAWIYGAEFGRDGRTVTSWGRDAMVRTWPLEAQQAPYPRLRHEHGVRYAEFSPDGGRLVTVCDDRFVRVWNVVSGDLVCSPLRHGDRNVRAAFAPDGRRIVTTEGGVTRVWDLADRSQAGPFLRGGNPRGLGFSEDGQRLVTANQERQVQLWEIATGQELPLSELGASPRWPLLGASVPVRRIRSVDGRRLLTFDQNVAVLRDPQTESPVAPPLSHREVVLCAAFSPDGLRVATGSADKTARVWDVRTGMPLTPPLRDLAGVLHAVFSPDGRRLATRGAGGGVQVWELSACDWPLQDLGRIGELLSGRRLNDSGALVDVAASELRANWEYLSGKYPDAFRTTAEDRARWHWGEAVTSLRMDEDFSKSEILLAASVDRQRLPWLGRLQAANEKWEASAATYAECLQDRPSDARLRRERAQALARLDRLDAALAELQYALNLEPTNATLWLDRARLRFAAQQWDAAASDLGRGLTLAPVTTEALDLRGQIHMANRNWDLALRDFSQARAVRARLPFVPGATETQPVPARFAEAPPACLDLTEFFNAPLTPGWLGPETVRLDLAGLRPGVQSLAGQKFEVRGVVQLMGNVTQHRTSSYPAQARGIPVRRTARRLHFLHGTQGEVALGTLVGTIQLTLNDGAVLECPIRYGGDVGEATLSPRLVPSSSNSAIAWTQDVGKTVRRTIYRTTWKNPSPSQEIVMIDYAAAVKGSSPFLLAVTVEP